ATFVRPHLPSPHPLEASFNAVAFSFVQPIEARASRFNCARYLCEFLLILRGPGAHPCQNGVDLFLGDANDIASRAIVCTSTLDSYPRARCRAIPAPDGRRSRTVPTLSPGGANSASMAARRRRR